MGLTQFEVLPTLFIDAPFAVLQKLVQRASVVFCFLLLDLGKRPFSLRFTCDHSLGCFSQVWFLSRGFHSI